MAQLACVDEEGLIYSLPAVSSATQEPEAGWYLGGPEELARQGDDAVHEVGLDEVLENLALAGLVGRHGAVGKDEACDAARREVVEEVLYPCEVGVSGGRYSVLPPPVVAQAFGAPVGFDSSPALAMPSFLHSTNVVPIPQNGSRTVLVELTPSCSR